MASNPTTSTTNRRRAGLALPLGRGAGGGYFASKAGIDLAYGDLLAAVFTAVGSRPMRRGFGSRIDALLLNPLPAVDDPVVAHVVRTAASRWCPGTVVSAVNVVPGTSGGGARGVAGVRITFGVANADGNGNGG